MVLKNSIKKFIVKTKTKPGKLKKIMHQILFGGT